MNATQAREYLKTAVQTETGKDALVAVCSQASLIIKAPERGDDKSTITVAQALQAELHRRYGF